MTLNEQVAHEILKFIKITNAKSICDFGCGMGDILRFIKENTSENINLFGVDHFSKWPKGCEPPVLQGIEFIDKDSKEFNSLLRDGNKFDAVISTFALHHFKYPIKELQTIEDILAPGGRLILADFSFNNDDSAKIAKNISSFVGEMFALFRGNYHRHHYELSEAKDLLSGTNLRIKDAFDKTFNIPEVDSKQDARDHQAHAEKMKKVNNSFESKILEAFFDSAIEFNNNLVSEVGIDYSDLFIITALKE